MKLFSLILPKIETQNLGGHLISWNFTCYDNVTQPSYFWNFVWRFKVCCMSRETANLWSESRPPAYHTFSRGRQVAVTRIWRASQVTVCLFRHHNEFYETRQAWSNEAEENLGVSLVRAWPLPHRVWVFPIEFSNQAVTHILFLSNQPFMSSQAFSFPSIIFLQQTPPINFCNVWIHCLYYSSVDIYHNGTVLHATELED